MDPNGISELFLEKVEHRLDTVLETHEVPESTSVAQAITESPINAYKLHRIFDFLRAQESQFNDDSSW